jgi:hypothetical protein
MQKNSSFRWLPVLAVALSAAPAMGASSSHGPSRISLTYHGGPMLQNVQVATLFWGSNWKGSALTDYLNGFFKGLFTDGRYLANLSQYDAGGYTIGTGTLATTTIDEQAPATKIQDSEIRAEIRAQIAAGNLPKQSDNTLYFVFTPPQTVVVDA